MGESLRDLEERLEQLEPRDLRKDARARLDQQIEDLAAAVGDSPGHRSGWRFGLGAAAAAAAIAGVVIFSGVGRRGESYAGAAPGPGSAPLAEASAPDREAAPGFETVDFTRTVGDGEDGGIVLDRFDEPMRAWNYEVREMELLLDAESGLKVRIVQERREQVRVAVTSF